MYSAVEQIMTAPERLVTLPSQASLLDAVEAMEQQKVQQVPVLRHTVIALTLWDSDGIIGILTRREI